MSEFDWDRFEAAKMEPRREKMPVPDLAAFFKPGETPEWEVRGLTAREWAVSLEAEQKYATVSAVATTLQQAGVEVQAMRRIVGLTKATPSELAKRLELFVMGSVNPTVNLEQAVLLAERFALDFWVIVSKIINLTGKGFDLAKPAAASQTTQDLPQA